MAEWVFEQTGPDSWRVSGSLTMETVATMPKKITKVLDIGTPQRIDFSGVEKMDSSGLASLIELLRAVEVKGSTLRFHNLPGEMRAVAEAYGILNIVPESAFQSG